MNDGQSPRQKAAPVRNYRASVEAVLALHSERSYTNEYSAPDSYELCVECRQKFPCATVKAVYAQGNGA